MSNTARLGCQLQARSLGLGFAKRGDSGLPLAEGDQPEDGPGSADNDRSDPEPDLDNLCVHLHIAKRPESPPALC